MPTNWLLFCTNFCSLHFWERLCRLVHMLMQSEMLTHGRRLERNASLELGFMRTVTPDGSDCYFCTNICFTFKKGFFGGGCNHLHSRVYNTKHDHTYIYPESFPNSLEGEWHEVGTDVQQFCNFEGFCHTKAWLRWFVFSMSDWHLAWQRSCWGEVIMLRIYRLLEIFIMDI